MKKRILTLFLCFTFIFFSAQFAKAAGETEAKDNKETVVENESDKLKKSFYEEGLVEGVKNLNGKKEINTILKLDANKYETKTGTVILNDDAYLGQLYSLVKNSMKELYRLEEYGLKSFTIGKTKFEKTSDATAEKIVEAILKDTNDMQKRSFKVNFSLEKDGVEVTDKYVVKVLN